MYCNFNDLYTRYYPGEGPDLLSVDIDSNDYHILAALNPLTATVIVLEYHPTFARPIEWVMDYNPNHAWDGDDNYSASLKAYELLLSEKGYALVGCTSNGNTAFFNKTLLANGRFHKDCSAEFHYEPQRFWMTYAFMAGHRFNGNGQ